MQLWMSVRTFSTRPATYAVAVGFRVASQQPQPCTGHGKSTLSDILGFRL